MNHCTLSIQLDPRRFNTHHDLQSAAVASFACPTCPYRYHQRLPCRPARTTPTHIDSRCSSRIFCTLRNRIALPVSSIPICAIPHRATPTFVMKCAMMAIICVVIARKTPMYAASRINLARTSFCYESAVFSFYPSTPPARSPPSLDR